MAVFLLHVGCIYPSSPFSLLNLPKSAFNLKRLSGHLNDELALRDNLKSEIALNFLLKRLFISFGKLRFFLDLAPLFPHFLKAVMALGVIHVSILTGLVSLRLHSN